MQMLGPGGLRAIRPQGTLHQHLPKAHVSQGAWGSHAHGAQQSAGDRLNLSATGLGLNKLLRTWGAISQLFGVNRGRQPDLMLDLAAIQETLRQAQANLKVIQERTGVMDMLKTSALRESEKLVAEYFGLHADGATLRVVLEEDMGGALASVSYYYGRGGRMENLHLHINMKQFTPDYSSNGVNNHVIENDRIIAHEMTHAVMGRTMDVRNLPDWFMEGTAEYIAGGMERVGLVLEYYSPQGLINRVAHPWEGDSSQYAAGYLAVRYMDVAMQTGGGLKQIMQELQGGATLDQAVARVSEGRYPSVRDFLYDFVIGGEGVAFLRTLDTSGRDAGSIKPGRGSDVVPDYGIKSNQPLRGFRVVWPSPLEGLQLGSNPFPWLRPTPGGVAWAYSRSMSHV